MLLVFLLLLVGLSITSTVWWKKKVDSGKTGQILYRITVVVVFLSICDTASSVVLFAMKDYHFLHNVPAWFMKDSTKSLCIKTNHTVMLSYLFVHLRLSFL